jgi:hypothetical protein
MSAFAFDLDGCLINSEQLIRDSYLDAGVSPPGGFLALGHHDWIPAQDREAVHARKNAAYLRRLAAGPVLFLSPWRVAETLSASSRVALLTSAPPGTVAVLREKCKPWPFTSAHDGMTTGAKQQWLAEQPSGGVYVDDQRLVTVPEGWKLVRYTRQSAWELYKQVTA